MTKALPKPWWQQFQVMAYVVGGLTALGGAIMVASKYINLPTAQAETQKKVEQVEGDVNDLKGWAREIQGFTRATQQMQQQQMMPSQAAPMYQQQASPVPPPVRYWQAPDGQWWCLNAGEDPDKSENWWRCS